MKRRFGRTIASMTGATVCLVSYKALLEVGGYEMPDDTTGRLLLSFSAVAACMVGSLGAILLYDRVGRRR